MSDSDYHLLKLSEVPARGKVRRLFWHRQMKTFHFFGGGMSWIWIKIVRLAVSSYHIASRRRVTFSRNCHFPPLWCRGMAQRWRGSSSSPSSSPSPRQVICPGCYRSQCATPGAHRSTTGGVYLQSSRLRLANKPECRLLAFWRHALCDAGKRGLLFTTATGQRPPHTHTHTHLPTHTPIHQQPLNRWPEQNGMAADMILTPPPHERPCA